MNKILFVILVIALLLCGFSKAKASEVRFEKVLAAQENTNQLGAHYAELVARLAKTESPKAFEVFLNQTIQSNWSEQDLRILKAVLEKWQANYPAKKSEVRFQLLKDLTDNSEPALSASELRQAFPDFQDVEGLRVLKNYRPLAAVDLKERQGDSARFVLYSDQHQPVGYWGKVDHLPEQSAQLRKAETWKLDLQPAPAPTLSGSIPDEAKKSWVRPVTVAVGIGLAVLAASYLQDKKLVIRR